MSNQGLSAKQVLQLQQKLSPQQIQMIKLLELPAVQLEQRVRQEIEENPTLEEDATERNEDEPKEISVDEFAEDDTPSYKYRANNYSRDDRQRQVHITEGQSLSDFLNQQLGFRHLSPRQRALAEYIVGSLDDDGYLRRDLDAMADDIAFTTGVETSEEELEEILGVIHELEPAGVGARTIQECLLLQMDGRQLDTPARRTAHKILHSHFGEFSKRHYEKLMARLGVNEQEFREALDEITAMQPKPANLYDEGGNESVQYVIPDFILDYHDGEFDFHLNSYNIPEVKVNKRYMEQIRELARGRVSSEQEKEALQFVRSKIESAKWFISAIKQRRDTLMRTMGAILDYQRDYFVEGDQSKLRPMILKDIADRTNLDVSTISRVVNSKYIQTHFGVISLKQLFSEGMQTDDGGEVSSYEIKKILTECIENEDKRHPLTDEVLMEHLNAKGYQIARRTVAKYREMLGIPVARLRREL
jgi:RNA polymerase sigma-54 factor